VSSLRRRLIKGLATILVLIFAAHWLAADWVIRYVAENQMTTRLEHDGDALLSSLTVDDRGEVHFNVDHLGLIYAQPFSGHYFILQSGDQEFRSSSMGEEQLIPRAVVAGQQRRYHALGPKAQPVLALTRGLIRHDQLVSLTVAEDLTEIGREIELLRLAYLALTVIVLLLAILLQSHDVRRALRPLGAIRDDLRSIGRGQQGQIQAKAPKEIQPLVDEINRLLGLVERRLKQSRTAIGNLAHALKTPLSVLFRAASDTALVDHPALSRQLREHTQTMHARIERELKRARLSGTRSSGAGFNPKRELESLIRLLGTIYEPKHLAITLTAPDCVLGYDRQDMLELSYVPNNADLAKGDLLVTSGLGGRFPPGYPVGRVVSVELDPVSPFARVLAEPSASMVRSREVLLLWPEFDKEHDEASEASSAAVGEALEAHP